MRKLILKPSNYLFLQMISLGSIVVCCFNYSVCGAEPLSPIQLSDVTKETGVSFVHTDGSSGKRYIVETVASGLATFDYNNDGLIDILFLNGTSLPEASPQLSLIHI